MDLSIAEIKKIYNKWGLRLPEAIKGRKVPPDTIMTPKLLKQLALSEQDRLQIISLPLLNVNGIGPVSAIKLWQKGVRPTNLEKHIKLLPDITKTELLYRPRRAIPHDQVTAIYEDFMPKEHVAKTLIAGSYRRLKPTSNDVDIVYWGPNFDRFLQKLEDRHGSRWIVMSRGPSTVLGIYIPTTENGTAYEVDLWIAKPEAKAAMILYATGSQQFNIVMRMLAKKKNMKLNQYGLWDHNNKLIPCKTEKDIFNAVGMWWRKPEERS
jgi:DNA polymerase/3'-5' exonuclease PolX